MHPLSVCSQCTCVAGRTYWGWLHEEVPYIITEREREAFKQLTTDDDREMFIKNFWDRRNPTPGSLENSYEQEYYQRIIFANERFGTGIPGWKTDRGRIYIMYGPPDRVDSQPDGDAAQGASPYPFEYWHYSYIHGVGTNVILNFVDTEGNGERHLTIDPALKDALILNFNPDAPTAPPPTPITRRNGQTESILLPETGNYTRLNLYTKAYPPKLGDFADLKAALSSKVPPNSLPFAACTDFFRATSETDLAAMTVQVANSDLHFQNNDGVMHAAADVYGEVVALGGQIVRTFGTRLLLDVPQPEFSRYQARKTMYQDAILLGPGRFKLRLALKDELSGQIGSTAMGLVVPRFSAFRYSFSSLVLADQIIPVPSIVVGTGPFWIGGNKVVPNFSHTFTRDQRLRIYMQVYELGVDEKTHKPSLDVRYQIEKDGRVVIEQSEDPNNLKRASQQFTAVASIPVRDLAPGEYTAKVVVNDKIKNQTISPWAVFTVR